MIFNSLVLDIRTRLNVVEFEHLHGELNVKARSVAHSSRAQCFGLSWSPVDSSAGVTVTAS